MQQVIEFVVLLVAVVFTWRRTAAWHMRQGRGKLAAQLGGLGAGIMAFVVVMGLIVVFDPPPGISGKAVSPILTPLAPTNNREQPKTR